MFSIIVKRILGVIALSFGAVLVVWFIYNQFYPTDEFKSGFKSVFQLILPIAFLVVGWKWLRYKGKGIDEITPPDLKCTELRESVKKAHESIHTFLSEVDQGVDGAFVKFPLTGLEGQTEHIWGYVHFYRDGIFNVTLANEPVHLKEGADGRMNIQLKDIEDWQIAMPDGRIRGAYSLIALFRYHERKGVKLTPLMKDQKAQLIDAR